MTNKEKIVFMGSPDYAVPILKKLYKDFDVCGIVTQPDQPVGRGKVIQPPPVKTTAQALGLPVYQPMKIRGDDFLALLSRLSPDAIVVAAYGKILSKAILDFPKFGCVNVHASLLPRWRGASPIHSAILAGDSKTGVTIMRMDEGVDTGAILSVKEIPIGQEDTTGSLTQKLADLGADLLASTLRKYLDGVIKPTSQPEEGATYSHLLKKEDGKMDFSRDAAYLERQVRACVPWPGAFLEWEGKPLRVWKAEPLMNHTLEAGQRGIGEKFPIVGTASVDLKLVEVQPAGKRMMRGCDYLNGARNWADQGIK